MKSICDLGHNATWWPGFGWLARIWWLKHDRCKTLTTCGVCGQQRPINDPPPTFANIKVGTTSEGKPILRPVLDKPIRMDPETGAICWCPERRIGA